MPVEFRDADDLAERGHAALLRILRLDTGRGAEFAGALLLVNAHAEPVEFVHNRLTVPETSLCAPDRLPSFAAKSLVASLFRASVRTPLFVVHPEGELDDELFLRRLQVEVPVGVVPAVPSSTAGQPAVRWLGASPEGESAAAALLEELARRGLIEDALTRAGEALRVLHAEGVGEDVVG